MRMAIGTELCMILQRNMAFLQERVRQIETAALKKMRTLLQAEAA
jgi:DNA-directed RNA polymerase sigma subunit (sigma70/sigma32)